MRPLQSKDTYHVGVLSIHPAPYRDTTFFSIYNRGKVNINVITLFNLDIGHSFWNLDKISYPNMLLTKYWGFPNKPCFHPQVFQLLKKHRYDVIIIPGYYHLTCWYAVIYCLLTSTPFILTLDTILNDNRDLVGSIRKVLVTRVLHRLLHTASAFWVPGKASRQYLCAQRIESNFIFEGCYNLDYTSISSQLLLQKDKGLRWREALRIDEDGFVFLMVANVTPNRRHDLLIESFSRVAAVYPNSYLLLAGQGTGNKTLMDLCNERMITNVIPIGPVAFGELPALFNMADVYVHSGCEPYSTAVAYAAIAGLPVVTTPRVGAGQDYVIEHETGFLVDSIDVTGFSDRMLLLAQDKETTKHFGQSIRKLACRFSSKWAANQFESAVETALK